MSEPIALTESREARDKAWARVCRVTSTRWDLTRFEKADDRYRDLCHLLDYPYKETTP